MDDALLVGGFERLRNLLRNGERLVDRNPGGSASFTGGSARDGLTVRSRHPPYVQAVGERRPFDELHDERKRSLASLETIDVSDVRVIQRGQHVRLAFEAGKTLRGGQRTRRAAS